MSTKQEDRHLAFYLLDRQNHRASLLVLCLVVFGLNMPMIASADVPAELVEELGSIVDEALAADEANARAWALRALALRGPRLSRDTLHSYSDNADLFVRISAGIGLLQIGRREGREILSAELVSAGDASRARILNRYLRHLPDDQLIPILRSALASATTPSVISDILHWIAQNSHGEVYRVLASADETDEETAELYFEALIQAGRPEAIDIARTFARSRRVHMRRGAVEISDAIGGEDSRSLLEQLLGDSESSVSAAAAFSLAPLGVAGSYPVLLQLARSGSTAERARALEAIRDGNPSMLDPDALQAMLSDTTDPTLRRRIHQALGATNSDAVYERLVSMVNGDIYEQRLDGLTGLGYTRRAEAVPVIGAVLLGGGGPELRRLAAEALGHMRRPEAAEPLLQGLERERGGEVKTAVVEALATAPVDAAVWPLAFLLSDRDEELVRAALNTLWRIEASQVSSQIEALATDHRSPSLRWLATLALLNLDPEVGRIRLMQAIERPPEGFMHDIDRFPEALKLDIYRSLLRGSNANVRATVSSRVLAQGPRGLHIWRELADSSAPSDMRQLAVEVLTAHRDPQDLPLFRSLGEAANRTMRNQALEAIIELGDSESEEFLRGLLESPEIERRAMAVFGLWNMHQR